MRCTVPCPCCRQTLTVIATPPVLGCPFCRAPIPNVNGRLPVGTKVRCGRCRGSFTAEAPPPEIRIFASIPEACPVCEVLLAVRKDLPPGKKVKCGQCGTKFIPRRQVEAVLAKPNELIDEPVAAPPPEPVQKPTPIPYVHKPASKTFLAQSKPASRTQLAPLSSSRRATQLAKDPLEETIPHAATPTLAEDEIDLLGTDLGVNLEIPGEKPPRVSFKAAPNLPEIVNGNKPLKSDPAKEVPATPAARKDHGASAKPPERPVKHAENGAARPNGDRRGKPDLLGRKKKFRPDAAQPATAKLRIPGPVEVAPGDVEVVDDEPVARQPAVKVKVQPAEAEKPQSYPSAEREAAAALLDDLTVEQEEQETDPAMPEGAQMLAQAQTAPRSYSAPVATLPRPTPFLPRRPMPAEGPSITIDGKKVMQYAWPVLAVAAVVFVIYYAFIGRGPSRLPVYEVEGIVKFNGEIEGARVTLFPEFNKKHRYFPTGTVDKDGRFKLTTYKPNDGAPAGHYKVKLVRGEMDPIMFAKVEPEQRERVALEMAQDPLIDRYANPANSGLTADVVPGKVSVIELNLN